MSGLALTFLLLNIGFFLAGLLFFISSIGLRKLVRAQLVEFASIFKAINEDYTEIKIQLGTFNSGVRTEFTRISDHIQKLDEATNEAINSIQVTDAQVVGSQRWVKQQLAEVNEKISGLFQILRPDNMKN